MTHRNLLLLAFDPGMDRRPDSQARPLLRDILERAQRVSGVESATLTTGVPLTFIVSNSRFVPEQNRLYVAVPAGKDGKPAEVQIYEVSK